MMGEARRRCATDPPQVLDLPEPVARYLRRVLPDPPPRIATVTLHQYGELRASTRTRHWLAFTASERITTNPPGFAWDARITLALGLRLCVHDEYAAGVGAGGVSLIGLPLSGERGRPELNEGALHRYLAESPWYPTALLPRDGLSWTPIDERAARAVLTDRGMTISLDFRFDHNDEVCMIFSPGRWRKSGGTYRRVAWEGRFSRYELRSGMRIPVHGEVGWYDSQRDDSQRWEPVWRGTIRTADHRCIPA